MATIAINPKPRRGAARLFLRPTGYALAIGWTAATALPLLWMFYSSFKTAPDLASNRWLPPTHWTFSNFVDAWQGRLPGTVVPALSGFVLNSVIVTFGSLILTLVVSAPAAYALARYRFRAKRLLLLGLLFTLAIPIQALIVPIWSIEDKLALTDTYPGLIIVYVGTAVPAAVLLLTAFLRSFPPELEDAARLDGLSNLGVLIRVVIPLSKGPLSAIAILLANGFWTEFLFALTLMPQTDMTTLPVGVVAFSGGFYTPTNLILAALTAMTVPIVILFIVFQKQLTSAQFQLVK